MSINSSKDNIFSHQREAIGRQFAEQKYNYLRERVDKLGFVQSFDVLSMDLVENMYTDIVQKNNQILALNSKIEKLQDANSMINLEQDALKYKMELILKENRELHKEVIKLMDQKTSLEASQVTQSKKSQDEIDSMKFLINELKSKLTSVSKENFLLKSKQEKLVTNLFEKSMEIKKLYPTPKELANEKEEMLKELDSEVLCSKPSIEVSELLGQEIFENPKIKNALINSSLSSLNANLNVRSQEMMMLLSKTQSRVLDLENKLKQKDSEITILTNQINKYFNYNALSSNKQFDAVDPKNFVVIDFLKSELRLTKKKYEAYIKHLLEVNKSNLGTSNPEVVAEYNKLQKAYGDLSTKHRRNENMIKQLKDEIKIAQTELIKSRKVQESMQKKEKEKLSNIKISGAQNVEFVHKKETLPNNRNVVNDILMEKSLVEKQNVDLREKILLLERKVQDLNTEILENNSKLLYLQDKYNSVKREGHQEEKEMISKGEMIEKLSEEKNQLEKKVLGFENTIKEKNKEIDSVKKLIVAKEKEIDRLNDLATFLDTQVKMFTK